MSAFNFIRSCGENWHIETDGVGYRGHNQKENSVTGNFNQVEQLINYINRIEMPPVCKKCDSKMVTESVTGIERCLSCEPFYGQPCGICRVTRAFCCC